MSSTSYLRLGARHWPVALVLTCGLLLGYYILRTYVSPLPREYQLDFGDAQWIQPAANSPIAYFRKKVFVTAVPEQAWLEVGATDSFQITVNGRHVALGAALKTRATGIYDIKSRLQSGTNIIAIEVNRNSFPGPAEILVCGEIKEPGRPAIRIISDEHWKVATTTGIVEGSEPWDSNLVQDETWPNAQKVRKLEPPVSLNWVATNPLLLQLPSVGSWIIARDGRHEAVFSTSVVARRSHQETWIQVASSGDLDLVINGQLVTTLIIEALQEKHLPSAAIVKIAARSPSDQLASSDISTADITATTPLAFKTYDISRWIKRGQNQIIAAVRSDYRPASLIVDGFTVPRPGSVERFQTDSTWQVIGLSLGKQKPKIEQPAEAGSNGSAPWGYLQQGLISDPQLTGFWVVLRAGAVLFLTALAIVAVWLVVSMLIADARDEEPSVVRVRDALFHTPVTVALLFLLLPSYDFRFPNTWSFQPKFVALAVLALLGLRLLHFYQGDLLKNYIKAFAAKFKPPYSRPLISYVLLALITILGFSLRFHALGYISFDHDEMGLVQKSRGVLIYGFPFNEIRGTIKPAVTYELVPYFLALSGAIFGYSEWAMRLPSCLWGTFTIVVIGIMGHRLFNWRTGLIAALIYACLPLNIRWAQNAFYPQQCQFMAMLTFWLFYETIRTRPFGRTWLTWASITFCLTFLSWEGSGFILPALFLALLVVRWGEWWWLKQSYLYRCLDRKSVV